MLAQPALDRALIAHLGHVDEVDHHEPGDVAQAQLAGDLFRPLEVGLERGLLDVALARRAARVDVDRGQRLGGMDDDRRAGLQVDHRLVQAVELLLDAVAVEQRQLVLVRLDPSRARRHQHAHDLPGGAVALIALDPDLVEVAAVEIADRALDQRALLVDRARRDRA